MEKKKGLSARAEAQTPVAMSGTEWRSKPAVVSVKRVVGVRAVSAFFAAPQVKVTGPVSAGGTSVGVGGAGGWLGSGRLTEGGCAEAGAVRDCAGAWTERATSDSAANERAGRDKAATARGRRTFWLSGMGSLAWKLFRQGNANTCGTRS